MKKRPIQLLLLEDNPGDARLMSEYLREDETIKFEVLLAGTLQAGLVSLAENNPDIILADLGLPDSQGLDTFNQLQTAAPRIPIVVLTGLNDTKQAAQAVKAGAQDYLTKDEITSSFLRRAIRYAIERKQTIEALQQNEERFRLMFENAPVGYQSLDADGCFLDVNDSWLELLGYTRQEVIGRSFAGFLHPDQADLFQERFPVLTQSQQILQDIDFTLRRRDGSFMEARFTTRLVRDGSGRFIRTNSAFQDISARKQSERAIGLMAETHRQIAAQTRVIDVLTLVGSRTLELIGNGYVIISQPDESNESTHVVGFYGIGDQFDIWSKKFNIDISRMSFSFKDTPPEDLLRFRSGKLELFEDGVYRLLLKKIPKRICKIIEKELKLIGVYTIGFVWEGLHHGGLTILAKNDLEPYREQIETTINQATLAIERLQSQEALSTSEAQYRLLAETSPDMIFVIDREDRVQYVNNLAARQFGKTPDQVIGKPRTELFPPAIAEGQGQALKQVLRSGEPFSSENRFIFPVGQLWLDTQLVPLRDKAGQVNAVMGVARDISARKQGDQQIRLQAAALESAANAMIITDRDGSIQWINPAYEQLTGYSLQEAIGLNPRILKSGVQPAEFYKNLWDTLLAGQVWYSELVNKRKDGSLYSEEETITPLLDDSGEITHFIGIKQDISERKQAEIERQLVEDDLRNSEERFRNILNTIEDGYYEVDLKGSFTFFNPALPKIFRYEADELMGVNYRDYMDSENARLVSQAFNQIYRTGVPAHDITWVVICKDGVQLIIEASASLIKDLEGNITGFRGIVRDVTQRKQTEADLHRSESELRALFAALPDVVLVFDNEGRYLKVTESNQDLLYKPLQELIGNTLYDVFPKTEADLFISYIQDVLNTKEMVRFEYELKIADKTTWFAASVAPMTENTVVWVARDVTDNKQAELDLQESHSLLATTLEATTDGILVVDIQGRITRTNQIFADMWGIPQVVMDTQDDNVAINYVLEKLKEPQAFIKKVEELYSSPAAESFDVLEFKDGRLFERFSRPQYQGETIVGRVWSFRDVTERKRSELDLKTSHSLLQATLESTADGILVVDLQNIITMTNQIFADMWGIPREQLEGTNVSISRKRILEDLKDSQAFLTKTQVIYADPSAESFDVFELKDGRIIERVSRPQYQGETIVGRVSSFRDVTERKQSENLVRESEAKYRSLFDNVPDGVYRTTPDGRIQAANKTLVAMLGFESEDEMIKANAYEMYETKNGRDMFLEEINKAGIVKNLEVQMRTVQGKSKVGLENTRAFYDENGEVLYYEGTLTDITERKQVETERQILLEIMQGLTTSDDLHDYLEIVHHSIDKTVYAKNFFVTLYNQDTGLFEEPYFVDEFDQPGASYDLGKSLTAYVFRSGKLYLNDPKTFDELVAKGEVELVGNDSPSWLGIPLNISSKTIGVMVVQDYESYDRYSQHDAEFLSSISGQVAQAIRSKAAEAELVHLFEIEQRRSQRLSDLQILSTELNSLHTEQELLERLVNKAALLSNSPVCSVMMLDEKTDEIILAAQVGLPAGVPKGLRIPVALLPDAAQAFKSGRTIIISNIDLEMPAMRKVLVHPDVNAFFAFPLVLDGIVAGAITLSSMQTRHPSDAEINTYELLARLASAALDNVRLFESINRSLQRMESLRRVDMAISASFDLVMTLNILLEQVTTHLGVDAADILVFDQTDSTLKYTCGRGFRSQALRYTNLRIGESFAGQAALERRTVHVPNLQEDIKELGKSISLPNEGFVSYWGVPLLAKGNIQGVLEVFSRQPILADQDWINFMETMAGQAAIAVDNVLLFNHLERSNADLAMAYDSTLTGWATALELRDNETEGHTRRVAVTTTQLAVRMGVRDEDIMFMRWGSLLHDIGKMGIPDSILLKPGPLSDEEWVTMRTHPVLAYEMLSPIEYLGNALDIPYCHHEKWDGSGYPRGLKGEQIPLAARIFAIVDVWDALTSDRPYRSAWTPEKTMIYIQEQVDTYFDPQVVKAFLDMVGMDGKLPGE